MAHWGLSGKGTGKGRPYGSIWGIMGGGKRGKVAPNCINGRPWNRAELEGSSPARFHRLFEGKKLQPAE